MFYTLWFFIFILYKFLLYSHNGIAENSHFLNKNLRNRAYSLHWPLFNYFNDSRA